MNILQHILTVKNRKKIRFLSFPAGISLQQQRTYIWSVGFQANKLIVYVDFLNLLSRHNSPPTPTSVLCISGRRVSVFSIIEKTAELLNIDVIIFDSICACPWISPVSFRMRMSALRTNRSVDIYLLCESRHRPLLNVDHILSFCFQHNQIPTGHID